MPNNHYLNISILSVTSLFSFISSFGFGISYITGYERDINSLNLSAVFGSVFLCNVACLTYNYIRGNNDTIEPVSVENIVPEASRIG